MSLEDTNKNNWLNPGFFFCWNHTCFYFSENLKEGGPPFPIPESAHTLFSCWNFFFHINIKTMSQQKILHVCEPPVLSDGMSRGGNFWCPVRMCLRQCLYLDLFWITLIKSLQIWQRKSAGVVGVVGVVSSVQVRWDKSLKQETENWK